METAVNKWLMGGASRGLAVHAPGQNRQTERIMAGLKARYTYKRLRPDGNRNRKVYFFLNVRLREEEMKKRCSGTRGHAGHATFYYIPLLAHTL